MTRKAGRQAGRQAGRHEDHHQPDHASDAERAALLRRIAVATPPKEADYDVVWNGGEGLTSYP